MSAQQANIIRKRPPGSENTDGMEYNRGVGRNQKAKGESEKDGRYRQEIGSAREMMPRGKKKSRIIE